MQLNATKKIREQSDMQTFPFRISYILVLARLLTASAHAATVPPANPDLAAEGATSVDGYGTLRGAGCNGIAKDGGGCESSFASLKYHVGATQAAVKGHTNGGISVANSSATASVTYFFEVAGPPNVQVPLILSATGSTSAAGPNAVAFARVESGGGLYACSGTGPAMASCGGAPASFSGSLAFMVTSRTLSDVLVTTSGSSTQGSGRFTAQAVAPAIVIDPSFPNAGAFHIVFSKAR
jgi:hypothetical protein